jgi:ABC-type lipoprotein export system ATPase subunit
MITLENAETSCKTGAGQTWVLRRINLKIDAGEFITIMGPSGAGKSSLLNIFALLDDLNVSENIDLPLSYRNIPYFGCQSPVADTDTANPGLNQVTEVKA